MPTALGSDLGLLRPIRESSMFGAMITPDNSVEGHLSPKGTQEYRPGVGYVSRETGQPRARKQAAPAVLKALAQAEQQMKRSLSKGSDFTSLAAKIRDGYSGARAQSIAKSVGLPFSELLEMLGLPRSTVLGRIQKLERQSHDHSDRLYRAERLIAAAHEVFADSEGARNWLTSKSLALGSVPLEMARTTPGYEAARAELEKLNHFILA